MANGNGSRSSPPESPTFISIEFDGVNDDDRNLNTYVSCEDDSGVESLSGSSAYSNCSGIAVKPTEMTPSKRRKLVLHFDVRNTILVFDSLTNDNVEKALNSFLAGVTWGRSKPRERKRSSKPGRQATDTRKTSEGSNKVESFPVTVNAEIVNDLEWVWCSDLPSLAPPVPGAITYYKFLERRLVRFPNDRIHLRQMTGDFTSQPIGRRFRPYFEKHLKLLEWNVPCRRSQVGKDVNCHRLDEITKGSEEVHVSTATASLSTNHCEKHARNSSNLSNVDACETRDPKTVVDSKLTIAGSDGKLYHYLMPSFVKLLYDLHADGRQFAVVLRTYGRDCASVLSSIAHIKAGNHPQFPGLLPIDVRLEPGHVFREKYTASFRLPPGPNDDADLVADTDDEIYRMLSDLDGVCGFVDDFSYWETNNFSHFAGKPFWIDPEDDSVQHIFFDDNIRFTDPDSIVDIRLLEKGVSECCNGHSVRPCRSLALDEIASLENVCLVHADLLACTSDLDYFGRKVVECEANYPTWLASRQTQCASRSHDHSNLDPIEDYTLTCSVAERRQVATFDERFAGIARWPCVSASYR